MQPTIGASISLDESRSSRRLRLIVKNRSAAILNVAMQKLEIIHLERIVTHYSQNFQNIDSEGKLYGLSSVVMRHYFGDNWSAENILSEQSKIHPINRAGRSFFRTDNKISEERLRHQERVVRLPELIYNLQNIKGIERKLQQLKEGQTEATFAELECAAHFHSRSIKIEFVQEIGIKGQDYDINAFTSDGRKIHCEAKCRIENTPFSKQTIKERLRYAHDQLPKHEPGIVSVKIPEAWTKEHSTEGEMVNVLREYFRRTQRVVAVLFRWEQVRLSGSGGLILYMYKLQRNDQSDLIDGSIETLLAELDSPPKNWVSFRQVVERA